VHKYSSIRSIAHRAAAGGFATRTAPDTGNILLKVQCQVLNRHKTNFDNYSLIRKYFKNPRRSICNEYEQECFAKFRSAALRIKKALGVFRELITTRRTTTVAFWDPPSGSKNLIFNFYILLYKFYLIKATEVFFTLDSNFVTVF